MDKAAHRLDEVFGNVYAELRGMARQMLRTSPPHRTIQPTILVHEAYLRLMKSNRKDWENRAHFFGAAAEAMRRILIEDARRKMSLRRGGNWVKIPLDRVQVASDADPELLLRMDEALERLAAEHPVRAQVVRLLFFGGLTAKETAEVVNLTDRTVKRHWAFARAWLLRELSESP